MEKNKGTPVTAESIQDGLASNKVKTEIEYRQWDDSQLLHEAAVVNHPLLNVIAERYAAVVDHFNPADKPFPNPHIGRNPHVKHGGLPK